MWTHPLVLALVAGLIGGLGSSLLSIFVAPRFQHRLWGNQKRDELRFQAIQDFNRLTNAYVAACLAPEDRKASLTEWLRDLNTAGGTIRALFRDDPHREARVAINMVRPYVQWDAADFGTKIQWANDFRDACHRALVALYDEILPTRRGW